MIDRYTRPEMAALWTKQKKFETWLEVELNATDAWVKLGKVPAEAAEAMRKNARFTVERESFRSAAMVLIAGQHLPSASARSLR